MAAQTTRRAHLLELAGQAVHIHPPPDPDAVVCLCCSMPAAGGYRLGGLSVPLCASHYGLDGLADALAPNLPDLAAP